VVFRKGPQKYDPLGDRRSAKYLMP
jgi:hypothetical protein